VTGYPADAAARHWRAGELFEVLKFLLDAPERHAAGLVLH
jgi:hypothetical protein